MDSAGDLSRPAATRSFQVSAVPSRDSSIVMHPGTGQTSWHRLQPTHSGSSIHGTRSPARSAEDRAASARAAVPCVWACGGRALSSGPVKMHWCAPSQQAVTQSWQPMHFFASMLATSL